MRFLCGRLGRLSLAAFGLWLAFAAQAYAQANIGATAEARNEVVREQKTSSTAINSGDPVFRDEAVRTGADSTAKFVFLDSTNLAVGPASRVVLDKFVYEGELPSDVVAIKLTKGLFRFTTGVLDKKDYKITTTTAAIGVRGTILDIDVQPRSTDVTLREGEAIVCPLAGGPCVTLRADGQTARVARKAGTTVATFVNAPVNFAALCGGGAGLCGSASYASTVAALPGGGGLANASAPVGDFAGGGASLCGR